MMLWCELHNTSGIKGGGITNFDPTEYEKDLAWLQTVTQVCNEAYPVMLLLYCVCSPFEIGEQSLSCMSMSPLHSGSCCWYFLGIGMIA